VALLEIRNLSKYFGGLAAIKGLDLKIYESEIRGLIGPNGAGKTTLFNMISGFFPPTEGKIIFDLHDITGWRAHRIAQMGVGRTFQATSLFMKSKVIDNVITGFHMNYDTPAWEALLHTRTARKETETAKEQIKEILDFMGIASLKDELAQNLPHGHQRILGICIALATNPRLLLLDEPVTGMHPEETLATVRLIKKIRDRGMTIVVVEHDMEAVMTLCDRITVLNYGQKIAEGSPEEIRENKEVIEAYLGREEEDADAPRGE
jgi:branched-chain amino acid transport system ATP-binding protein